MGVGVVQVVEASGRVQDEVEARDALTDKLLAEGMITSEEVEMAFRGVSRLMFVPAGTPLEIAYGVDEPVVTKRDRDGRALSSVSAAYIQARMLEQAELRPGMTVLEIGSGGLNAALIAEVVGVSGRVLSVDIDPEITNRTAALLDEAGYASRVRVIAADAEHGVPGEAPFDAIIVTVGAWDLAAAWLDQLAIDGVLVLPLIMNGATRTIGFRRDGDHLTSTSTEVAGFVPMRGGAQHSDRLIVVTGLNGKQVTLRFDGDESNLCGLDGVLAMEYVEVWSSVTIKHQTSFADLHLWFAWFLPGFCRFAADEGTAALGAERGSCFPFGVVRESGFAYLAVRPALDGAGVEFGARAHGRGGELAATAMVEQIQAWDRHGRHTAPTF